MRLDLQYQAYRRRVDANMKSNKARADVGFALNDLVLCRTQFFNKSEAHHRQYPSGKKLVPTWGLPCRVVKVKAGRKAAFVRSLLSGKTALVHIQDVRFIKPPECPEIEQNWEEQVAAEAGSMFNPEQRDKVLATFWKEVFSPQAGDDIVLPRQDRKR